MGGDRKSLRVRAVLEHIHNHIVTSSLECGVAAAPRVGVQAEEVGPRHVILLAIDGALEVGPRVLQDLANVGGGVADGDGAVDIVLDIVLQVTLDGLRRVSNDWHIEMIVSRTRMYCGLNSAVSRSFMTSLAEKKASRLG